MSFPVQKRLKNLESQITPILASLTALTLSKARHAFRWLSLKPAGALAITLPKATGKGGEYRLFVAATVGGALTIRSNGGTDIISGIATVQTTAFQTAANTNTITLNGTTTGGVLGSFVLLQDMGPGQWLVEINANGTSAAATCFSNT